MSRVPMQDLARAFRGQAAELESGLLAVARSGRYLLGDATRGFEAALAGYLGRTGAVAVGNGTDALELSLRALGIGPGDEVVAAANAGVYLPAAAAAVGARVVFADVRDEDLQLDPRDALDRVGPRTRAVVVTHLFGDLAPARELAARLAPRGIPVVEDCAQALGVRCGGTRAGALGTIAAFSFYPTKNLGALGDGGAVAADDPALLERVRALGQYGWRTRYASELPGGRNSRMDELQARVLALRLPGLDAANSRRGRIVARYREAGGPVRLVTGSAPDSVAHLCVGRHPDRDRARAHFEARGIETAVHYPGLACDQPAFAALGFRADGLARTRAAQREIFSIPCFPELEDAEVERVAEALATCPA